MNAPTGSESLADFVALAPSVFEQAEATDGFFGHATAARPDLIGKAKFGEDFGPWGIAVAPRFYEGFAKPGEETMITTLSLWRDVKLARQFCYGGLHRAALTRRSDWFRKADWPSYVLWWICDEKVPKWAEGAGKLEVLADNGPSSAAFTFTNAFNPDGEPV